LHLVGRIIPDDGVDRVAIRLDGVARSLRLKYPAALGDLTGLFEPGDLACRISQFVVIWITCLFSHHAVRKLSQLSSARCSDLYESEPLIWQQEIATVLLLEVRRLGAP
jgi:hypothetical protein